VIVLKTKTLSIIVVLEGCLGRFLASKK
jgi:hypothetical protein